jgi:FkbH-like protein
MWETDWAEKTQCFAYGNPKYVSSLAPAAVDSIYLLHWEEHCVECAVPQCYRICPLYSERRDGACKRFENGIFPNLNYSGLYSFGAEIRFRRWGKIESSIGFYGAVTPRQMHICDFFDRILLSFVRPASSLLRRMTPSYPWMSHYGGFRHRVFKAMSHRKGVFDEFVVEVWNLQSESVRLVIECVQNGPKFRTSVLLKPGKNLYRIPVESMNIDLQSRSRGKQPSGFIRVYMEHDAEAHLIFTWLDFVRYAGNSKEIQKPASTQPAAPSARPAEKVKCVIWDLDNTIWDGILGEQNPEEVSIRPLVKETMLALDSMGILQSIASKNDHDDAWRVLERLGISHLFLYPQINWQPKSGNIQAIVKALNIGDDACAFVDDSPFERAEVSSEMPGIRVYAETALAGLLSRPEFHVAVTGESKQRRLLYEAEAKRKQLGEAHANDYEAFLGSCNMVARLFSPTTPAHVERSLELLQRTNQLNLSAYRYEREEFQKLLRDKGALCLCTACGDRFGDYGIVGFASFTRSNDQLILWDFVMSCRIAQKKVENAWFNWLVGVARSAGYPKIHARYVKTARNHVLLDALHEVGFTDAEDQGDGLLLELDCHGTPPMSALVSINADAANSFNTQLMDRSRAD